MRKMCVVLVIVVAACKEAAKPAPAPAPTAAPPPVAPAQPASPSEHAPTPTPPSPPEIKPAGGIATTAEYEAKAFDLIDKLTAVFAKSGTNCDKLAAGVEAFVDQNKAAFAATDEFEAANATAEDDLVPKLQERNTVLMQKVNASMQACQTHEGVKAALAKLPK